jgi:dTDP-4-amino-4,6-dideoxygalactose transaminase
MPFLPFSAPDLGDEEIAAASNALRSGWVTTGPEAAAFEGEFADFVGGDVHAMAVNSATAGLHLALEALGVGPGDEVVVPTWTFTATAEVVRYLGATPVVVDVDEETLNIDVDRACAAITARTKAVIVVHFSGLGVDMKALNEALTDTGIRIVEDAAHALPTRTSGVTVGSSEHSDAAVFSFYANKTMTTGEGGMVTTRDPQVAERIRIMRLHGIDRDVFDRYRSERPAWFYDIVAPGFKYNLTDSAAAIGRVQLRRVEDMAARRRQLAERYQSELETMPIEVPVGAPTGDLHAWHLFVARLSPDAPIGRDDFIRCLTERGVGTSVHFIPLHRHTYWRESLKLDADRYPVAESVFPRVVSLPLFSKMTDADQDRVIDVIKGTLVR